MRVSGRFSLTALVILASELFSLVLSAVRSPKHCLHTIKATKRDLPCPVNAIMNQAASVRHKIFGCSFCRLICVARHLRQPNAIVAQGIDSTLSPCTGQYVGGFSRYNQHMHGLQVFQVTQCQETGVFLNGETLRCGRDRRDLWGRSMFWCSFSASQWIVCYTRYWWIDRNT